MRFLQGFVEGNVEITTQHGFLIGRTPIALKIAKDLDEKPELPELAVGALINRVFASYAHVDHPIIMACREVYKGLGIQLFVDHEDIHGGEFWREDLAVAIGSCDLFQLFWSTASASSQEVRNEWSQALQIVPQKHRHFVRPVYWQQRKPVPDPPEQLSGIQFRYLDLSFMEIDEKNSGVKPAGAGSTIVAPLELENQLTILPLVQNCDSILELVRKEMGRVVAFLEAVTGLRYIPAPTLLVDHYAVRSVREKVTVNKQKENAESNPPASEHEWAIQLLRSLLLAFHCGDLRQLFDYHHATEFFGFADILELGDFQHIARVSEGDIHKLIEDLLAGREVKRNDGSNAIEKALAKPTSAYERSFLEDYLAHLAVVCHDNDRQDLERRFSRWLRAKGAFLSANIEEQDLSSVVQKMQEAKVKDIRQRYSAGVYPLLEQERTTLCRLEDVKATFAVAWSSSKVTQDTSC